MRVAGVQLNPNIASKEENVNRTVEFIKEAADHNARLIVFPECAITGYIFDTLEEATAKSEPIPGPSEKRIVDTCKKLNVFTIIGTIEQDDTNIFNTAIFSGPDGLIGKYRKIHLPYQGVDRFITPGHDAPKIYGTELGRVGINICYDAFLPESSRVLSLMGAELIALPTNWAKGVEFYSDYLVQTRALENHINYMAVNRVGTEKGFAFYGRSKIISYNGRVLAEGGEKEEIIYADLDIVGAQNKKIVRIPGKWEIDVFNDRKPEFYSLITKSP